MLRLRTVGFPHSRLGCADLSPVPEFSQSSHLARRLCPAEGGRGGSCCPRGSRKLCQGRTLDMSFTWSSCSPACPCSVLCQQLFLPQLHHGPCRAAEAQPGWAPPLWFSPLSSHPGGTFHLEHSQVPGSPTRSTLPMPSTCSDSVSCEHRAQGQWPLALLFHIKNQPQHNVLQTMFLPNKPDSSPRGHSPIKPGTSAELRLPRQRDDKEQEVDRAGGSGQCQLLWCSQHS